MEKIHLTEAEAKMLLEDPAPEPNEHLRAAAEKWGHVWSGEYRQSTEPVIAVIGEEPDPEHWHQLSDLEIVQRALEDLNLAMYCTAGRIWLYSDRDKPAKYVFDDGYYLLTWAKQTLGVSDAGNGDP